MPLMKGDRRWGLILIGFVVVQVVFLYLDVVVLSPPSPDAPIGEFHAMIADHADLLAWHPLVTLFAFFGLFVPGVVGLRNRLNRSSYARSGAPDVALAGGLLIVVSLVVAEMALVVLGLVPPGEISDSMLRTMVMINTYAVWVAGAFALALFVGAAAVAMLRAARPSRWLGWTGVATSGVSAVGAMWLVGADFDGPLFSLGMLGRAMFLAWIAATGVWLMRTTLGERDSNGSDKQPQPASA